MKTFLVIVVVLSCAGLGKSGEIQDFLSHLFEKDSIKLEDISFSLTEENFKGNYSLRNGILSGISTVKITTALSLEAGMFSFDFNTFFGRLGLTGDYEVAEGYFNISEMGSHTLAGKGLLNVSITGFGSDCEVKVKADPVLNLLSVEKLKANFTLDTFNIVAENLLWDDKPMDWTIQNIVLKGVLDGVFESIGENLERWRNMLNLFLQEESSMNELQLDVLQSLA